MSAVALLNAAFSLALAVGFAVAGEPLGALVFGALGGWYAGLRTPTHPVDGGEQ